MWTTIKQTISKRKIKHNQLGKHVCSNARFQYRSYIYVYINVRKVTISSVFFKWMGWVLYCLHCRNLFLKFSLKHSHCQLFQCTIFSLFFLYMQFFSVAAVVFVEFVFSLLETFIVFICVLVWIWSHINTVAIENCCNSKEVVHF